MSLPKIDCLVQEEFMTYSNILLEKKNAIAYVTVNRPKVLNALNMATMEELRKCAWPTWEELKGSTIVVTITIVLLGAFCYGLDTVFYYIVKWMTVSVS